MLHRGLYARVPLSGFFILKNIGKQWSYQHRHWHADWQEVVLDELICCIHIRHYIAVRHLPECVIQHHTGRTSNVMAWDRDTIIGYRLRKIVGNRNSIWYNRERKTELVQPSSIKPWNCISV